VFKFVIHPANFNWPESRKINGTARRISMTEKGHYYAIFAINTELNTAANDFKLLPAAAAARCRVMNFFLLSAWTRQSPPGAAE
jgi:hypothetical protein